MLKTAQSLRPIITIFHNPQLARSKELVAFATERLGKSTGKYDLEIEDHNPTENQLESLKKMTPLLQNVATPASLPKPTLVAWFDGKVAVDNTDRATAIIKSLVEKKSD